MVAEITSSLLYVPHRCHSVGDGLVRDRQAAHGPREDRGRQGEALRCPVNPRNEAPALEARVAELAFVREVLLEETLELRQKGE